MQIGYVVVMARLLEPSAFGLLAMAQVVLRFGSYFAQMGMGQALIQKDVLSEKNIRAAFTTSVFLGITFFVVIYLLAPLSIYIFNDIEVIPIIRVMALSFMLTGLYTTSVSLLRRNFKFKEFAIVRLTSYIIGYIIVGITFAMLGFGVWSLIYAALTQAFFMVVISYLFVKHSLRFIFEWEQYRKLFFFGSKISVISFLEFFKTNIDVIYIGKMFSAGSLGFYNRGQRLINLSLELLRTSSTRVFLSTFSRIQNDINKLRENYLKVISIYSLIIFPFAIFVFLNTKYIVYIILGTKWEDSIVILKVFSLTSIFMFITSLASVILESVGKLKAKLIITIAQVLVLAIMLFSFKAGSIMNVAICVLLSWLFGSLLYHAFLFKYLKIKTSRFFITITPGILIAFIIGIYVLVMGKLLAYYISSAFLIVFVKFIGSAVIMFVAVFKGPFKELTTNINNVILLLKEKKHS